MSPKKKLKSKSKYLSIEILKKLKSLRFTKKKKTTFSG